MTLFGLALTAPAALLPALQSTWQASPASLALFLAAILLGGGIASLIGDYGLERFGPHGVMVAGLSGLFVSSATLGLATSMVVATCAALLFGFTGGLTDSGASARLAAMLDRSERVAAGLGHLSFAIGAIAGPLYSIWLSQTRLGWRGAVVGLGVAAGILTSFVWSQLRHQTVVFVDRGDASLGGRSRWAILMGGFGASASVGPSLAFSSWLVFDLIAWRRQPWFWAGVALSLFWTTVVVGRLATHWLALHASPSRLVWSSALVTTAAFFALPFVADRGWMFVVIAVAGLASAVQFPSLASWVTSTTSGDRPAATGLLVTASDVGGVACILILGRLATLTPSRLPAMPPFLPASSATFAASMAALAGIVATVAVVFQVVDRRESRPVRPLADDEQAESAPGTT